jgi:hypothetical protein
MIYPPHLNPLLPQAGGEEDGDRALTVKINWFSIRVLKIVILPVILTKILIDGKLRGSFFRSHFR